MTKATSFVMKFDFVSRFLIMCSLIYLIPVVLFWSVDSKPPITMTSYSVIPAPPGGTLWVRAEVTRDLDRNCSTTYSRRFIDSAGWPQPIEVASPKSAEAAAEEERRTPGVEFFSVPLRANTTPGTGIIETTARGICNPWHWANPIEVTMFMQAEVLEP